jgi:hypothetical protein
MQDQEAPSTPSRRNRRSGGPADFFGSSDESPENPLPHGSSFLDNPLQTTANRRAASPTAANGERSRLSVCAQGRSATVRQQHFNAEMNSEGDGMMDLGPKPTHTHYHSRKPHRTLSLACASDHGESLDNQGTQLFPPVKSFLYARRQLTNSGLERLVGAKSRENSRDRDRDRDHASADSCVEAGSLLCGPSTNSQHPQENQPSKKQRVDDAADGSEVMVREGGVLLDESDIDGSFGVTWAHIHSLQQHLSSICMREDERRVSEFLYSVQVDDLAAHSVTTFLDLDESVFGLVTSSHVPQVLSSFLSNAKVLATLLGIMLGNASVTDGESSEHVVEGKGEACASHTLPSTCEVRVDADTALRRAALACEILAGRHPVAGGCMRQIANSEQMMGAVFTWLQGLATAMGGGRVAAHTAASASDPIPHHGSTHVGQCSQLPRSNGAAHAATGAGAAASHFCTSGLPAETHAQFLSRLLRAMVGAGGHVHAGDATRVKLLRYVHQQLKDMIHVFCRAINLPCMQELLQVLVASDEEGWGTWVEGGLLESLVNVIAAHDNTISGTEDEGATECDSYRSQCAELAASTLVGLAELTSGESRGIGSLPMDRRFQSQDWLQNLFSVCSRVVPRGNFAPLLVLDALLASEITDPYLDPDEPPPLLALMLSEGCVFLAPSTVSRHSLCTLHLFKIYYKVSLLHRTHPCGNALSELVLTMTRSALGVLIAPKACSMLMREASCFLRNVVQTASCQMLVQICVHNELVHLLCKALLGDTSLGNSAARDSSEGNTDDNSSLPSMSTRTDADAGMEGEQTILTGNGNVTGSRQARDSGGDGEGAAHSTACRQLACRPESMVYAKEVLRTIRDRTQARQEGECECECAHLRQYTQARVAHTSVQVDTFDR